MSELASRLKTWRAEVKLSQDRMAAATGIPLQTMKGYELGHRQPGADALAAFAATGVNINWLLTGVGPMHAAQPVETCQIGQVAGSGAGAQPPAGGIPGPQRFGRRLDALAGMLGNMPDAEASALIDEFASRAQTQQQLSELKQAVQQLKQGQAKRG